MNNIKIKDLEVVISKLFADMKDRLGEDHQVELSQDYYWFIDSKQLYNPSEDPEDLTLGQLYEDWQDLRVATKGESSFVSYDLVKLSSILRFIGEETVW